MSQVWVWVMCFPVAWVFGWAMAMRWVKVRWLVQLEQVMAQTKELKTVTEKLEALLEEKK